MTVQATRLIAIDKIETGYMLTYKGGEQAYSRAYHESAVCDQRLLMLNDLIKFLSLKEFKAVEK